MSPSKKRRRGRPKATRISVQSLERIPGLLARLGLPRGLVTYRAIAEALTRRSGVRVTVGTLYRFATGSEPVRPQLRAAFGLPAMVETPACAHCGKVHVAETCTASKPRGANGVAPVTVWAHRVRSGAVVLGRSRRCGRRRCGLHFVGPGKYCSEACRVRARKAARKRRKMRMQRGRKARR